MKPVVTRTGSSAGIIQERNLDFADGDEETFSSTFQVPDDAKSALVTVENAVLVDSGGLPGLESGGKNFSYFFVSGFSGIKEIKLFMNRAGAKAARVTICFFRKEWDRLRENLPCEACKLTAKTVFRAILIHIGMPMIPGTEEILTFNHDQREAVERLAGGNEPASTGSQTDMLQRFLLESALGNTLAMALNAFEWLVQSESRMYQFCCTKLGCCQESAK